MGHDLKPCDHGNLHSIYEEAWGTGIGQSLTLAAILDEGS
jgi:hypothetical protein